MSDIFKISGREFSTSNVCIIAEVAQAHDGSLGIAHSYIDAAAECGVDAIKFQTHIASAESTRQDKWRVKFSYQDASRFDYWKRMEFTKQQWKELKEHADEKGLIFMSSPFSLEAVELLEDIGIEVWKIASGEITNKPLLEKVCQTGKPILISSGMSNLEELESAVNFLKSKSAEIGIFQCTSMYPCPPEKTGLNIIPQLRKKFNLAVGLSDHSGTIYAGMCAASLGIEFLELHIVFSKKLFGPDTIASVTIEELKLLVDGIRFIEKARHSNFSKSELFKDTTNLRALFMKSIVAAQNIPRGTILEESHITLKKPGNGLPAEQITFVLGKKVKRDIETDELIKKEDLV